MTDARRSLDQLGVSCGWRRGTGDWAGVAAAIAQGGKIEVIQEAGSARWRSHRLGQLLEFEGDRATERPAARLWISPIQRRFAPVSDFPKAQWHPRVLWVGLGCGRGAARDAIATAVDRVCQSHHLATAAIAGVATIDSKANEAGLLAFCRSRALPLRYFSSAALESIAVPHPSQTVAAVAGTPSVAEAAALLAAQSADAPSPSDRAFLRVTKQIVRQDNRPAITVAIAQACQELIDRTEADTEPVTSV